MTIPTAIICFNRVEETKRLVNELLKCPPGQLYFFLDGPRVKSDISSQREIISYIREMLGESDLIQIVRWPNNAGVRRNFIRSIDSFFSFHSYGAILEDDCIPSPQFFEFCEWANSKLSPRTKIFGLAGSRFPLSEHLYMGKIHSSRYMNVWGWATWRDNREHFRLSIDSISHLDSKDLGNFLRFYERRYFTVVLENLQSGTLDSWAYLLQIYLFQHKYDCLYPPENFVQNIGINQRASHTKSICMSYFSPPISANSALDFDHEIINSRLKRLLFDLVTFYRNHLLIFSFRDVVYHIRHVILPRKL